MIRVFKIAKKWTQLNNLIQTVKETLKDVSTFTVLLVIIMLVFSLMGRELFAYQVRFNEANEYDLDRGVAPDSNFDTIYQAFTTVFVVMTADGWSAIYFSHYLAKPNFGTTFYFIALILVGQRIMLNLFLAILL